MYLFLPEMHRNLILRRSGNRLLQLPVQTINMRSSSSLHPISDSQLFKNTRIQAPLRSPALPKLLVVIVQALPVCPESIQTLAVDILYDARRTTRDLPSLLQTFCLALAIGFGFAVHEIVIVGFASCADEESGGEERSGRGTDFWDFRNGVREWCGVNQHRLVESGLSGGHGGCVS